MRLWTALNILSAWIFFESGSKLTGCFAGYEFPSHLSDQQLLN